MRALEKKAIQYDESKDELKKKEYTRKKKKRKKI